ncbi:MAG TPA: hypothetical protein VK024_06555 [Actinomycetaceae bacterium]|nr:hypothetical protein [Actinomycetaceae bacterium]
MDRQPRLPDHALRTAFIASGGACLALGVLAASLLVLAGADSPIAWPAVTLLGGGQVVALAAAGVAGAGWWRLGRADTRGVLEQTARRFGFLQRVVLVWCIGAAAAWVIHSLDLAIAVLLLAAVAAQLALVLGMLRRGLTPA